MENFDFRCGWVRHGDSISFFAEANTPMKHSYYSFKNEEYGSLAEKYFMVKFDNIESEEELDKLFIMIVEDLYKFTKDQEPTTNQIMTIENDEEPD